MFIMTRIGLNAATKVAFFENSLAPSLPNLCGKDLAVLRLRPYCLAPACNRQALGKLDACKILDTTSKSVHQK